MKNKEISLNTKKDFAQALKKLLKKEPLDAITVKQLLTLTNKSRPTFYYHFQDIPDLIKWTVKTEIIDLLNKSQGYDNWDNDIYNIFQYFYENPSLGKAFYENLDIKQFDTIFRKPQINVLFGYIDEIISKENLQVRKEDRNFIANFFTGGFTEIVLDWLGNGQQETPKEMKKQFCRTQKNIIVHSLKVASKERNKY